MADLFGQGGFGVRLDWGPAGARATQADVSVVVDVLSFSTAVTVAVERGMRVFPYRWNGAGAAAFAAEHDAVLAVGRLEATKAGAVPAPSLSPAGLLACEAIPRLVLPSPNGSTIAAVLQEGDSLVTVGCLRNAQAVARWLAPAIEEGRSVAVIAAGERWGHDDSLRPALEDHLGAGAILSGLVALGFGDRMSPEASAAAELFDAGRDRLRERLHDCVGGRELTSRGFAADVDVAADLDASVVVPVLLNGAFGPATVGAAHYRPAVPFEQQRADYLTALTWVSHLMATTPPAQLGLPTPCDAFDVRALMGHLIGTAERALGTAERRSTRDIPHVVTDVPDGELASTYAGLVRRIGAAWARLSGDDEVRAPWGECSALEAARGYTVETVTHGWDLAVATGRDSEAPDGIASRCVLVADSVVPQRLRGVMYADPVSPRSTASATDRLASLLGRQRP